MTTNMQFYSYTILRYTHDVTTGEFINAGVVLYSPADKILKSKTKRKIGRIKNTFPDLDRLAFTSAMGALDRTLKKIASDVASSGLFTDQGDALTLARKALPVDYSSLQWSDCATGLSDDLEQTLNRLFERFVTRYDEIQSDHKRSDDDIWRPVKDRLKEREIKLVLENKEIVGKTDNISFTHAWKNGVWHAYQPVSLDLANADSIKDKARRLRGHLDAVGPNPSEPFKLTMILGKPAEAELVSAYETAKSILSDAPGEPIIYEEDQIEDLVSNIASEFNIHLEKLTA